MRFVPGWKRLLLIGAPITLVLALVAGALVYASSASSASSSSSSQAGPTAQANAALGVPAQPGLLVDVVGAVDKAGLYRLPRGERVFDAIAAAGGFSPDADMSRVPNLAGRLKDGEQVKVPFGKTSRGTAVPRATRHRATLEELAALPGFTEVFAQD